jgi:prepilin-type N-terminal cleavage/methylation domain-containing protein
MKTSNGAARRAPVRGGSRGFTLIELLTVIGIVLILVTVLLVAIRRVRAQSRFALCAGQLRQQVQAHMQYAADFNNVKPPLWQQKSGRVKQDYVSPDVKWFGTHVGQGLLVKCKYLDLGTLLDPSEAMGEDTERDRERWEAGGPHSGSSYVYFWRSPAPPEAKPTGTMTYLKCEDAGEMALVMDLNAEKGNRYEGEYEGRQWVNHPVIGQMNVGYSDGSVRSFPVGEAVLRYPADANEELEWVRLLHARH